MGSGSPKIASPRTGDRGCAWQRIGRIYAAPSGTSMNDRLTNHGLTPWLLHAAASRLVEQSNPTPKLTGRGDNLETIQVSRMKATLFALRLNELLGIGFSPCYFQIGIFT
jgi:hypothetical protein